MAVFTDEADKPWEITVNVTQIKRVRSLLKFDLAAVADDGRVLDRLATDAVLLVDVLYVLCMDQAKAAHVSDEDFGRMFAKGDIIQGATNALLEALADFFPEPRKGLLKGIIQKSQTIRIAVAAKAQQTMDDPRFDETVERLVRQPGSLSGIALESSASTPAPSLSAS